MAVIAFIGTGNMGGALARAAAKSPLCTRLLLANRSPEKAKKLCEELGAEITDNRGAAAQADVLFLGVKPQGLEEMAAGIRDVLAARERCVVVSMAAGWTVAELEGLLGGLPVVRILPNIPVAVGEGVTLLCASDKVTAEEKELVKSLLAPSGMVAELGEVLMDAASGVTGCGPAFAAMFIEALADGGGGLRPAAARGDRLCRADARGHGAHAACLRRAPRRAQGPRLLPRREHDPGRKKTGG